MSDRGNRSVHLYAGFAGGLTLSLLLQPLDLLKTRLQQLDTRGFVGELKSVTHWRELWRGTLPLCVRTLVGSGLYLSCLNVMRSQLARQKLKTELKHRSSSTLPRLLLAENMATGAVARGVVGWLTMPVTVLKVRYELNRGAVLLVLQTIRQVYGSPGRLGNFWKGYWVTTLRDAPNAGLYVLFYEQFKQSIAMVVATGGGAAAEVPGAFLAVRDAPGSSAAGAGMFSMLTLAMINSLSAFAALCLLTTITAPFDTVKTRMQLAGAETTTARGVVVHILKHERVRNLFDGLSMRLVRKGFSSGIAWGMYEELVKWM